MKTGCRRFKQAFFFTAVSLLLSLFQVTPAGAQESESKKSGEVKRQPDGELAMARKAELLEFARSQDAQLGALLETLERQRPQQFRSALVNLARDEERLSNLKVRDLERHGLELQQWKINQRLQMVAARMVVGGEKAGGEKVVGDDQLRVLLQARQAVRKQILELELRRAREKVSRVEEQLARFQAADEGEIERQVEQLLTRARRSRGKQAAAADGATESQAGQLKKDEVPEQGTGAKSKGKSEAGKSDK